MKLCMMIAFGLVAACASNKPAEDPSQAEQNVVSPPTAPVDESTAHHDDDLAPSSGPGTSSSAVAVTPTTGGSNTEPSPPSAPGSAAGSPNAGTPPPPTPNSAASADAAGEPDNTRVNKRDRSATALTPMDQGNGAADLKITKQIRQAVMADSSLSFVAKNVKIITANGKVTLRGPVKSEQERQVIETSARKVAGETNVDNQIEVKK